MQYKLLLNYANMLLLTLCLYVTYFYVSYVPVFIMLDACVLYDCCNTDLFRCVLCLLCQSSGHWMESDILGVEAATCVTFPQVMKLGDGEGCADKKKCHPYITTTSAFPLARRQRGWL